MVQHFFMVDFMLDMHGANNLTAMKLCPTTTSRSKGKRAVTYINFESINVTALAEKISLDIFVILVIDLEET